MLQEQHKESAKNQNERRREPKRHFKFKELVPVAYNGPKRKTSDNDNEVTSYPPPMREHLVSVDFNDLLLLKRELHYLSGELRKRTVEKFWF